MSDQAPRHASPLNDSTYNISKFVAQIALPALGTLYFALSQIWGLPKGAEVVGTITVIDAFLGVLLGLSTKAYNNSDDKYDGALHVKKQDDDSKLFSLELHSDPNDLEAKKEVTFKVNPS